MKHKDNKETWLSDEVRYKMANLIEEKLIHYKIPCKRNGTTFKVPPKHLRDFYGFLIEANIELLSNEDVTIDILPDNIKEKINLFIKDGK